MRKILGICLSLAVSINCLAEDSLAHVQKFLTRLSGPDQPVEVNKKHGRNYEMYRESHQRRQDCLRDEMQIFEIENSLLKNWRNSWQQRNFTQFDALTLNALNSRTKIFPKANTTPRQFNGIELVSWGTEPVESIEARLGAFKEIMDVEMNIVDYTTNFDKRDVKKRFSTVEAVIQFDIRGTSGPGVRREERGRLRAVLNRQGGNWKISNLAPINGERLEVRRAPAFENTTQAAGLSELPIYARTEAIRRGGYALASADINGDGRGDLLVGFREGVSLLIGDGEGHYKDATKGSGLEKLRFVKTAIFADLQNHGQQDLVVTILEPGLEAQSKGVSSVKLFHGDGAGHFQAVAMKIGDKTAFQQPMPAALGDFNGDGYLDLYVGYPGIRDFTVLDKQDETRDVQGLYLNDRKGSFKDFKDGFKFADYQQPNRLFPHAGMAADIDQKGGVDLLVVDDRNNLSPTYMNDGKGHLRQVAQEIGLGNAGYGMSVAIGDYNNDGVADLLWTNVNFFSGQRLSQACGRSWQTEKRFDEEGLRVFKGTGEGKFTEMTEPAGLNLAAGQGAAGVTFLDYDNDGWMDIYLVNGLWSGSPGAQDLSTVFTALAYEKSVGMNHALKPEDFVNFKALLASFEGTLEVAGNAVEKKGLHPNMLGYQHNRLFHNNHDGTFTEIGFMEGADLIADGYVVGTMINASGKPDLILRNGDPGSLSNSYPVVQYLKNGLANTPAAVILSLEGTKSNHDAFGAFAIANFSGHKQVQHLVANSGSVQNERLLHFGMGQETVIPELEVHWPSGLVQTLKNVKPGRWHIKEAREPAAELLSRAE